MRILFIVLLVSIGISAQSNFGSPFVFPGVPSGLCASNQLAVNSANGNLYSCLNGVWVAHGGASGVTVNSAVQAATVDLNNTTPVTTPGAGFENSQFQTSTSGSISSVSVQHPVISRTYRTAIWASTGAGSVFYGDDTYSGSATGNHSVGDANNPPFSQINTSTVNNSAGNLSGQAAWRVGHGLYLWVRMKISSTTVVRYLIGFESNSNGGLGGSFNANSSDTMNGLFYVGFMFSSTLGHTQWQCVKNNQTANITVASNPTTAPDTTAFHTYEVIEESSGTFGCYIDGSRIASSLASGITAGVPLNANVSVSCLACVSANNAQITKSFWEATY